MTERTKGKGTIVINKEMSEVQLTPKINNPEKIEKEKSLKEAVESKQVIVFLNLQSYGRTSAQRRWARCR